MSKEVCVCIYTMRIIDQPSITDDYITVSKTEYTKELINMLSINCTEIVSKEHIDDYGISWGTNGVGSRITGGQFCYIVLYKNGKYRAYPPDVEYNTQEFQNKHRLFMEQIEDQKGNAIVGVYFIKPNEKNNNRPIRKDIRSWYIKQACVICASKSDLVVDHKNDLYNNSRVLDTKTQTFDDFQTLCNSCNLRKRAFAYKRNATNCLLSFRNIPQFSCFPALEWEPIGSFDPLDPDCLNDTYYYDPVAFMKRLKHHLSNRIT